MPWFKGLLGVAGGCSRHTLQYNVNRGMPSCFIPSRMTIPYASPSSLVTSPLPMPSEAVLQYRTLTNTDHPLPFASHRRSFLTCLGAAGDDDAENENDPEDGPHTNALNNQTATYPVCAFSEEGMRPYMEDEYFYTQDGDFAAVFDGHGGKAVSQYLREHLYANVQAFLESSLTGGDENTNNANGKSSSSSVATLEDYQHAIVSAIEKVDREVQSNSDWSIQGSTAVAVWLHEDHLTCQKTIVTANVGDSRAVLSRNGKAYDLSKDHKPNDPEEKARIEALGGSVVWRGSKDLRGNPIYRVNGILAPSRAVGDGSERPSVVADPDITFQPVQEGDDNFIIVATDGLWDVFDSDEAVEFITALRDGGHELERIATLVVHDALRRGADDNITVVIIWLDESATLGDAVEQEN